MQTISSSYNIFNNSYEFLSFLDVALAAPSSEISNQFLKEIIDLKNIFMSQEYFQY